MGTPTRTYVLPSGLRVAAGGTREMVGSTDRPWQKEIELNPNCPLCAKKLEKGDFYGTPVLAHGITWNYFLNQATPFPWHLLIIPEQCWEPAKLRVLGGFDHIVSLLRTIWSLHDILGALDSRFKPWERNLQIGIHVGWTGAQNQAHFHCHLLDQIEPRQRPWTMYETREQLRLESRSEGVLVFETQYYLVFAGGARGGQCLIVAKYETQNDDFDWAFELAQVLLRLIEINAVAFKSKQGLPPDFMIGLQLDHGEFSHGHFSPVLNHRGFTEEFALLQGDPIIIPWPHEATAAYLKKFLNPNP